MYNTSHTHHKATVFYKWGPLCKAHSWTLVLLSSTWAKSRVLCFFVMQEPFLSLLMLNCFALLAPKNSEQQAILWEATFSLPLKVSNHQMERKYSYPCLHVVSLCITSFCLFFNIVSFNSRIMPIWWCFNCKEDLTLCEKQIVNETLADVSFCICSRESSKSRSSCSVFVLLTLRTKWIWKSTSRGSGSTAHFLNQTLKHWTKSTNTMWCQYHLKTSAFTVVRRSLWTMSWFSIRLWGAIGGVGVVRITSSLLGY